MQKRQCPSCQNHSSCEQAYQRLGRSKAPPVMVHVFAAFVLPMVTFVLALAASQEACAGLASAKIAMLVSFLMALGATVTIAAAGAWWLRLTCNEQQEVRENG
jgi:hypothetical protein